MEDNKSELAIPKKLSSYKANPNKRIKCLELKLITSTLTENNNNKLIIYRRQLVKGKYNLSA